MRVTLFYNPSAGAGDFVQEELVVALEKAGHEVVSCSDEETMDEHLEDPGVVVVAGGDGSVRRIAMRLLGRQVPIAILPVGTANNIARSLGLPRDPLRVIQRLDSLQAVRRDVGHVTSPWTRGHFLEGAGFGPFARTALLLSHPAQHESFDDSTERLARDRELLAQMIRNYAAQDCEIQLDEQTLCGHCIAVHIMNLPIVGPNLELAPEADPNDGQFDVVLVEESQRQTFAELVASGATGTAPRNLFTVHRSRAVTLKWAGAEAHVDDELYQVGAATELEARVVPDALTFLACADASR